MSTRQNADLAEDGPYGRQVAPVDALAGLQHIVAHDVLFEALEDALDLADNRRLTAFGRKFLEHLRLDLGDFVAAQLLLGDLIGLLEVLLGELPQFGVELAYLGLGDVPWLLGSMLGEADDGVDDGL